jgi:predicted dehydrogenase
MLDFRRRARMGIKVGLVGVSNFGSKFVPLFKLHPLVDELCVAELDPDRRAAVAKEFGIARTFASHDELCASDVDAIAIFTQRWTHGPLAIKSLKAGKHVYSAVPSGVTLEELGELVELVKSTGLTYMLGETEYYTGPSYYCRERFARGDFGRFVHGEGHYFHDMLHFYWPFYRANQDWKPLASYPPMLYPTHSAAFVLTTTFDRMTEVSCAGFTDDHPDGIFDPGISRWQNPFSNQAGFFRMAGGGTTILKEFRRIVTNRTSKQIFGTMGSYQEMAMTDRVTDPEKLAAQRRFEYHEPLESEYPWTDASAPARDPHEPLKRAVWQQFHEVDENPVDGVFDYEKEYLRRSTTDVSDLLHGGGVVITDGNRGNLPRSAIGRTFHGSSLMHPIELLPEEFLDVPSGHGGSHQYLVSEFLRAVDTGKLPPTNVWFAARLNAPGIVAHESSKRDGELLKIPDFGRPPEGAELLDPLAKLRH